MYYFHPTFRTLGGFLVLKLSPFQRIGSLLILHPAQATPELTQTSCLFKDFILFKTFTTFPTWFVVVLGCVMRGSLYTRLFVLVIQKVFFPLWSGLSTFERFFKFYWWFWKRVVICYFLGRSRFKRVSSLRS